MAVLGFPLVVGTGSRGEVALDARPDSTIHQVLLYFIASSANSGADVFTAVRQAKVELIERCDLQQCEFSAYGVSIDPDISSGLKWLLAEDQIGSWTGVQAGGGWFSDAAMKYIWNAVDSLAGGHPISGIPQVVLAIRDVEFRRNEIIILRERVVRRVIGFQAIRRWVDAGAPLEIR